MEELVIRQEFKKEVGVAVKTRRSWFGSDHFGFFKKRRWHRVF